MNETCVILFIAENMHTMAVYYYIFCAVLYCTESAVCCVCFGFVEINSMEWNEIKEEMVAD